MPVADDTHRLGGTRDRGVGQFVGMRERGGLARHAAQAKALRGIEGRRLQPPVVERKALRQRILQIQLAVVAAVQRLRDDALGAAGIELGVAVEDRGGVKTGHASDIGWRGGEGNWRGGR